MQEKNNYVINFQPVGIRVNTNSSQSLLHSAQMSGILIASICGGVGVCDSCKIRLVDGNLTGLTHEEISLFTQDEHDHGYRLACQSFPLSDLIVEIPPESLTAPQRLQVEGSDLNIELDPLVVPIEFSIPEPTISDLRADITRLKDGLKDRGLAPSIEVEHHLLRTISPGLRENNWHVTVAMRENKVVALLPVGSPLLGLAMDIGTTKLAGYLCDFSTGSVLAKVGAMNPQTSFGEDVISRISYINNNLDGSSLLQKRLVETLNRMIIELCQQAMIRTPGVVPGNIIEAVVVGNTAMHHIFAGLPVRQLGTSPYVPAVSEPIEFSAHNIGLNISPGAQVYLPSNIAGYVGADHVAMLLAADILHKSEPTIALDIGTNTEITLAHEGNLYSCSCASGPAFEGAHIQAGMRAAPGAIERVQVINGEIRVQTIDDLDPVGICGSGILDAIACLLQIGAVDRRGSFTGQDQHLRNSDGKREFVLINSSRSGTERDIVISRQDINEIQLAKGAIRAGIDVLLEHAGISADAIREFIIAGAFGTYINLPSAIQVGMFPSLPLEVFHQVGNAAGAGARQLLLSAENRHLTAEIAQRIQYIELSNYPNFTQIFSRSLFF